MFISCEAQSIAKMLEDIYERAFGGKNAGRYKISRVKLRCLAGIIKLETIVEEIIEASRRRGYIVIDLGDYFAVISTQVMDNYRPVPRAIIEDYTEDAGDD